ncbi:MAG: type II toxin-antitoxin system VapC family toxin [Candidatus Binataceae bacterium]
MRVLLDTHTFIWWLYEDPQLSARAREMISSAQNEIVVSVLTGWEIVLKTQLLRDVRRSDLQAYVTAQIAANGFQVLPLTLEHALRVAALPNHHKDPFDRALIAQAQVENLPILSADRTIARYPVEVIW